MAVQPGAEVVKHGFVGVDATAAGDADQIARQLDHGVEVFLGRGQYDLITAGAGILHGSVLSMG